MAQLHHQYGSVRPANRLLSSLPDTALHRLLWEAEPVDVPRGVHLIQPRGVVQHVHFPECGLVSLVPPVPPDDSVPITVVGHEGMVGVGGYLDPDARLGWGIVEIPIKGWCVPIEGLQRAAASDEAIDRLLKRYIAAQLTEMRIYITCVARHSLAGRLARWLLTVHDRVRQDTFPVTQQVLAGMTLASRQRVNQPATDLREAGLIEYQRGVVTIVDRDGLTARACECYEVVRRAFETVYREARDADVGA